LLTGILTFVILVGLVGLVVIAANKIVARLGLSGGLEALTGGLVRATEPPAQVHVGQPLAWRELLRTPWPGILGTIVVADFDADGDDELLVIGNGGGRPPDAPAITRLAPSNVSPSYLVETDSSCRNVALKNWFFVPDSIGWDYDGDGRAEVIPSNTMSEFYDWAPSKPPKYASVDNPSLYSAVLALDGSLLDCLYGGSTWQEAYTADFDGDGKGDLALFDYSGTDDHIKCIFYSEGGKKLASTRAAVRGGGGTEAADVDGDGRAEMVGIDYQLGRISCYRYDLPVKSLGTWQPLIGVFRCADMNQDGSAEAIADSGYYDIKNQKAIEFEYPPMANLPEERYPSCCAGDFDGDGQVEAAVLNGEFSADSGIYFFDKQGACTYYEEFGRQVESLHLMQAGGKDYLALVCSNGTIICYP